jgi:hypothetical protein
VGCAALLIAALAMVTGWRRAPVGRLQWDGQRWRWESWVYRSGTALEPPVVVLDVQFALLLRLNNQAGAVWCCGPSVRHHRHVGWICAALCMPCTDLQLCRALKWLTATLGSERLQSSVHTQRPPNTLDESRQAFHVRQQRRQRCSVG